MTTAYDIAGRFIGIREIPGHTDNPQILAMLKLDMDWPQHDEIPWCSGFGNYPTWILRLPRSKSLLARSWLDVGYAVTLEDARVGFDLVILKKGGGREPGPENKTAPGHVGFYAGREGDRVLLLGGNQNDAVNVSSYPISRILGIRRLV